MTTKLVSPRNLLGFTLLLYVIFQLSFVLTTNLRNAYIIFTRRRPGIPQPLNRYVPQPHHYFPQLVE